MNLNIQNKTKKNIKKYYTPSVSIIYFSESDLDILKTLSKLVVEHVNFIKIGDEENNEDVNKGRLNCLKYEFHSWKGKNDNVMNPFYFFKSTGKQIIKKIEKCDIVVLVYKSNRERTLHYVDEIVSYLHKNDVFTFHFSVENFISPENVEKQYKKLIKKYTRMKQVYIPIKEESIIQAYKNASIANRNHYTNMYVNNLMDSFIAPFFDPVKNPDHFSKIKSLFYQDKKNFESKVVTTLGYSDDSGEYIDIALIKALSNPIFYGAFDASQTFIVNVKMPYFTEAMIQRINYILKFVVGEWKTFIISSYVGRFEYNKYCEISIMAINVDDKKLIKDTSKIDGYIKKIIVEIANSKKIFNDELTKEILLSKPIDLLE